MKYTLNVRNRFVDDFDVANIQPSNFSKLYEAIKVSGSDFFSTDYTKRIILAFETLIYFMNNAEYEKCAIIKNALFINWIQKERS